LHRYDRNDQLHVRFRYDLANSHEQYCRTRAQEFTMNTHRQVFVSSAYTDLNKERTRVIQTLVRNNYIPEGMQLFPATDERQFELIKKIIDVCDFYILIVGNHEESTITENASYTEKEYHYALEKGLKIITLLHQGRNSTQEEKTNICHTWVERLAVSSNHRMAKANHLVKYWKTLDELSEIIDSSLTMTSDIASNANALTNEKPVLFKRLFPLHESSVLPALSVTTVRNDNGIFDDADALIAIAQKSFTKTAKKAVDENDRLGIPTHGSIGDKLVVHHSPKGYPLI